MAQGAWQQAIVAASARNDVSVAAKDLIRAFSGQNHFDVPTRLRAIR